jgi:transposase
LQDGRKLRRYKRRWKVERTIAWLCNFRRLAMRWEGHIATYLGFIIAGMLITLHKLLDASNHMLATTIKWL